MQKRSLGSQGLVVSELGLGCMGMSEFYGTADEDESIASIHRAIELGVTFLDTADMYGPFPNERLVGKVIADRRDQVTLATKFGNERAEDGTRLGVNGKPEYVHKACDASLERLGVDHILQPSKRLNHNAVPTVLEKAPRVASTDSRERLSHRLHQGLAGSGLDFAQEVLYLGEGFFDRVEVRRVGRQVQQLCSSLLEQCAHPLSLVS